MDQLALELVLVVVTALINGIFMGVFMYIGLTKGSEKTVDVALKKIEKKSNESPTAQRMLKFLEKSDEIFGDDKLVENVTRFFKEAGDLVSSEEAKNFFKNTTKILEELTGKDTEKMIKMPKKKEVKK